ncbi:MAG: sigma-54-dependent Fis family transcriptional regulator [Deltaproteobacteria bacterium]|nr:sigma-54-dependent Fis family transcriptional regulator [Deltaproteobacteria bacterium]
MLTHILAIDDNREFLTYLRVGLRSQCTLSTAENFDEGAVLLRRHPVDIVLLDIALGQENGLQRIRTIKELRPTADVVIVTGHKDPQLLVTAVRLGAADYLIKPFAIEEVVAILEKLAPYRDIREKHAAFLEDLNESFGDRLILGRSAFLLSQLERARKLKGHGANILIEGESGTGKELFARYIHRLDEQPDRPFVAINCAAIPENLLESELFGHEKGAFTGAIERKIGKFELAHRGDLFLDEVSSLKKDLQAKILRAIQEQEIVRIGSVKSIQVRFRVIAACNDDLEALVEQSRFRRDLFHRLRVITLQIPPLRDRRDDIPILAAAFLKKYATMPGWTFNKTAMMALQQYAWPGNVRELENLIQSLVILVPGPTIMLSDLPEWIFHQRATVSNGAAINHEGPLSLPDTPGECLALKEFVATAEQVYVARALEIMSGDKSKAAAILQVSRSRLYEKLKDWGMTSGGITSLT